MACLVCSRLWKVCREEPCLWVVHRRAKGLSVHLLLSSCSPWAILLHLGELFPPLPPTLGLYHLSPSSLSRKASFHPHGVVLLLSPRRIVRSNHSKKTVNGNMRKSSMSVPAWELLQHYPSLHCQTRMTWLFSLSVTNDFYSTVILGGSFKSLDTVAGNL